MTIPIVPVFINCFVPPLPSARRCHALGQGAPLAPGELNCRMVMDLIYRPQKTRLLNIAAKKGISIVSGVEMFLAQGIAQWEIWTEKRAPEALMRRAVLGALREEEKSRQRR